MTRFPPTSMRASDADRDAVLAELSEHFQAGRLTAEEYDERSTKALQARTYADLAALTDDLPETHAPYPSAPQPVPGPVPAPQHQVARPGPALATVATVLAVIALVTVLGVVTHGHIVIPWVLFFLIPVIMRRRHRRW